MSGNASTENRKEYTDDEISLKNLILNVKEFALELLKNWWLIGLFCIPFLCFFLYKHFTFTKNYKANLTFMVNEDEGGSGIAGVSGVLGSFGLGGPGGGDYNLEKMLTLLKSRKIVQEVLLTKANLEEGNDYFANHLIKAQEFQATWSEWDSKIDLSNFMFTNSDIENFTLSENTALKFIHAQLIGNEEKGLRSLLNSAIFFESGIMEISMTSRNEQLSITLIEALYAKLSDYYVSQSIEKQLSSYTVVAEKADSLQTELRSAEYSLANFMDKNRGLYNRKDQLEQLRLEAKVKMLGTAYVKVVEQKEIAEFSLNDQTPVVQIIDMPISPIEPAKSSLVKSLFYACLIGGFLGVFYVIARKIVRDALA